MVIALSSYRPDLATLKTRFRTWHVESLLNQSADLIDRCLEQLREAQALEQAHHRFQIELMVDERDLALDLARAAEGFLQRDAWTAERRLKQLNDSQPHWDASAWEAQKLYDYQTGSGQGSNGWTKAGQNNAEKKMEGVARAFDHDANEQQKAWAALDERHHRSRLDIRAESVRRRREQSARGGAFGFEHQRVLVLERLQRDYQDAVNRVRVAEEGLNTIYAFESPQGALPPPGQSPEDAITHVALWIRSAMEWLVAYGQLEQAVTRVLSVRGTIGEKEWKKAREAKERFALSFNVPVNLFPEHFNIRLRGIAASLVGSVGVVPWSLVLSPPRNAVYRRASGLSRVDQIELPRCVLGRVENRTSYRSPEVCGQISLANASPFGETKADTWSVDVIRPAGTGESFGSIDDILLEFSTVGTPTALEV